MDTEKFCPGSRGIRDASPEYVTCTWCGEEVEIWTDEMKRKCANCGGEVFRERKMACIDWCQYAEQCVGKETLAQLKNTAGKA